MSPELWRRAEEVFHQVLDAEPAAREAALQQLCGPDGELRAEVAGLLASCDAAEASRPPDPRQTQEKALEIGPYRVEKVLGEGGMGKVYLAARADRQFDKKVAIKLIRGSGAPEALLQRFYTERQILAGMEHPNIARLIDGGVAPDGQPYFVMDYVDGLRLDKYCDEHTLTIRQRLELFRKVCAAVNYAHQHLVVHRDLKPSNILVTEDGEPKLLDFGVAKVVTSSAELDQTATAGLFLTPLYASPELLRGQSTTVATDVYSLGVILYELLSGRLPHDEHTMSPGDLINAIMTQDAQLPSHRMEGPAGVDQPDPEELARRRGTTAAQLRKILRGDLDGIVLKALAKTTAERYASAEQLSLDIGRYLEGRPVTAVQGSRVYAARKFVLRHKTGVVAAALAILSLVSGLAGTLWQASVARRERHEADLRFDDARNLANYVLFSVYGKLKDLPGSTPVQADLANRTLEYLDRLAAARGNDPALLVELAEGYLQLGDVMGNPFGPNIGQTSQALAAYQKGWDIVERLYSANPRDQRIVLAAGRLQMQMGGIDVFRGKSVGGLERLRRSVEILDALARIYPAAAPVLLYDGSAHQQIARNLSQASGWIGTFGDSSEVAQHARTAKQRFEAVLTADPANTLARRLLAVNYQIEGSVESGTRPREALAAYQKSLEYLDGLPVAESKTLDVRRLRASLLMNYGWTLGQLEEFDRSLPTLEQALSILNQIAAADSTNAAALYHRAIALRNLGIFYGYNKQYEISVERFRTAIGIYDQLIQRDASNRSYPMFRAEVQTRCGDNLGRLNREVEGRAVGEPGLRFLVALAESKDAAFSNVLDAGRWLANIHIATLRDPNRGLGFAKRAVEMSEGKDQSAFEYLSDAYAALGDYSKALDAAKKGLALLPPTKLGEPPTPGRQKYQKSIAEYQGRVAQSHR